MVKLWLQPPVLAPYAEKASGSRGRFHEEDSCPVRSCFERDRDRVVHSTAFRRMKHKTQVFINVNGDHYRTRLTHSLEVANIARTLARSLGLDEYLSETIALAHDLGHPPFGHTGERRLNQCMEAYGGFDHNAHTIKILVELEEAYAAFPGLNLSWETLEGLIKHNGPLCGVHADRPDREVHPWIHRLCNEWSMDLENYASLEAQVASIADDIAYVTHDLEDGVRAHVLPWEAVVTLPHIDRMYREVLAEFPHLSPRRLVYESIRRLTRFLVRSTVATSEALLEQSGVMSANEVRSFGRPLILPSVEGEEIIRTIKLFLQKYMYHHPSVERAGWMAHHVIEQLFDIYMNAPHCMPMRMPEDAPINDMQWRAVWVGNFIAGMSDRYAMQEYQALCHPTIGTV